MTPILTTDQVTKTFQSGSRTLTVLKEVSLQIAAGASCAIVGPSGSGKTTLLGLCAGLDRPTSGSIVLNGFHLGGLDEDERAGLRNELVGFVFQNFQLMPTLTALENVMVPLELRGANGVEKKAKQLLDEVGLADRADHYPVQLSGGEQQRVALARAFINQPKILFADEPTGNLDAETSERIESLLFELNRVHGTTLMVATHDLDLARRTDRIIKLKGGMLISDEQVNSGQGPTRLATDLPDKR